jgi:hypothetical protein
MTIFKKILSEVAEPKSEDEKQFKDLHIIELHDDPNATEAQFNPGVALKPRLADYKPGEDVKVYEEVEADKIASDPVINLARRKVTEIKKKIIDEAFSKVLTLNINNKPFNVKVVKSDDDFYKVKKLATDSEPSEYLKILKDDPNYAFIKKNMDKIKRQNMDLVARSEDDQLTPRTAQAEILRTSDLTTEEAKFIPAGGEWGDKEKTHKEYKRKNEKGITANVMSEEEQLDELDAQGLINYYKKIKAKKKNTFKESTEFTNSIKFSDGTSMNISKEDSKKLNDLFKNLNPKNAAKMKSIMSKNKAGFMEILSFAKEAQ